MPPRARSKVQPKKSSSSFLDELNAEPGQIWELSSAWTSLFSGDSSETYLLLRRLGQTHVWEALVIETGALASVTLNNILYERVV